MSMIKATETVTVSAKWMQLERRSAPMRQAVKLGSNGSGSRALV